MTPLVKHLYKMRNRQIRMGISPELQEKINILIRENQFELSRMKTENLNEGQRNGGER
jgi:hypothetical protein